MDKPKLEFKTNIPQKFIFVKMFKQGESSFKGKTSSWFACEVKQDGAEKTLFASEAMWNKLKKATEGDTIEATLAEIHGDDGKTHKEWQITINGVESSVSKTKEIAETGEVKNDYLKSKAVNEQEKNNNIKWLNALNNATALTCALYEKAKFPSTVDPKEVDKMIQSSISVYANYIYSLTPPVFDSEGNLKDYEGTPFK